MLVALFLLAATPDAMVREVELVQTDKGQIAAHAQGRYKGGVREGMWAGFWPDGARRWAATYIAGKRHMLFMAWRQDGTLEVEETYAYGKLHGVSTRYGPDGRTIVRSERYERGTLARAP